MNQGYVVTSMRAFMRRLGFQSPSVKQSKDVPGMFVITAYDPVDRYNFCRSYSLDELKCIFVLVIFFGGILNECFCLFYARY